MSDSGAQDALVKALEAVLDLHKPYGIYSECDHDHKPDDEGVVDVEDVGFTCKKLYNICRTCCLSYDCQSEECADSHSHGPDIPFCATRAAIASAFEEQTK